VLRNIVVLALEELAGGVLALASNDADARSVLNSLTQDLLGQTILLLDREVQHDC
jgi:hypothetical protein